MSRIGRVVVPRIPHHITQRGNDRQVVFLDPDGPPMYLQLLRKQSEQFGLTVVAYCLMGNHVHLVAVPAAEQSLAKAVGRAHFHYTQWFNERYGRSGHLWQARFYSCPMDDAHACRAMVYVERNPVRAGAVQQPWEYDWSSARAHLGASDHSGLLDLDGWRQQWDAAAWRTMLAVSDEEAQWADLREHTGTGRPLGSKEFLSRVEALAGRPLHRLPPGRPKNR
jgi:putative transposase